MYTAAKKGDIPTLTKFINEAADLDEIDSYSGLTPLLVALQSSRLDAARLLIDKGADVNVATSSGKDGWSTSGETSLMMAAGTGHLDTVKLLIEKSADVNAIWTRYYNYKIIGNGVRVRSGKAKFSKITAFGMAAERGHLDVARLLIDKGADVEEGSINTSYKYPAATACSLLTLIGKKKNKAFLMPEVAPNLVDYTLDPEDNPLYAWVEDVPCN